MRFVRGTGGMTMTDNKIIETWKKIQDILKKTENVVLQKEAIDDLVRHITNILDLINRQQAEIERLKKGWKADVILTANVKAEAYKEFAERLKDKHRKIIDYDEAGFGAQIFIVEEKVIDNLLKEMVGDNNA